MTATELITQQNITWDGKRLLHNGSGNNDDRIYIQGAADAQGISMNDILTAAREQFESARRTTGNEFGSLLTRTHSVALPPQIGAAKLCKFLPAEYREGFNEKDRSVFTNIYFSAGMDGLHMYCRRGENSFELAEIPLSNATDRAPTTRITAILSKCVKEGRNIAALMQESHIKMCSEFKKVLDAVKENPDENAWSILGKAAAAIFPVSYYKAGGIYVQYEKKSGHVNFNGSDQQVTMVNLLRGYFSIRGEEMNNPIDVLATAPEALLADRARLIDTPVPLTNDPAVPAMHYIDLKNVVVPGPHPRWDFYWKRYTPAEAKVYKAFIWSILNAKNSGRQMLYIYDPQGYSGKSVVTNVIAKFVGEGFVQNLQKDSLTNQFAFSKIYDKRLVVYSDNKNPSLARSEKFHLITGHDFVEVERKGSSSFNYRLNLKVIANGNTALTIDTDALHEKTRVIILKPRVNNEILREICVCGPDGEPERCQDGTPKFIGDSHFEEDLLQEFPAMLEECRMAYSELCPKDSDLILPDELYEEIDSLESDEISIFNEIINTYFTVGKENEITPKDLGRVFDSAVRAITASGDSPFYLKYDDFVEHLRKKIPYFRKTRSHAGPRVYIGLSEKKLPCVQPSNSVLASSYDDVGEML